MISIMKAFNSSAVEEEGGGGGASRKELWSAAPAIMGEGFKVC